MGTSANIHIKTKNKNINNSVLNYLKENRKDLVEIINNSITPP